MAWDFPVNNDRTIQPNHYEVNTIIPSANNISIKKLDKLSEYSSLEIEISKMWNLKTATVSVIVWGLISKGADKHLPKTLDNNGIQKMSLILRTYFKRLCLCKN